MYIEEHSHCFMHYFGVETLSEMLFSPPLMKPGDGARYYEWAKEREMGDDEPDVVDLGDELKPVAPGRSAPANP